MACGFGDSRTGSLQPGLVRQRHRRRPGRPEPRLGGRDRPLPLRRRRGHLGARLVLVVRHRDPIAVRPRRPARASSSTRSTTAARTRRCTSGTTAGSSGRTTRAPRPSDGRLRKRARVASSWTSLNNNYGVTQFYHGAALSRRDDLLRRHPGQRHRSAGRTRRAANGWARDHRRRRRLRRGRPRATRTCSTPRHTNLSLQKSTNGGTTFASATTGITEPSSQFGFIAPFVMDPANSQTAVDRRAGCRGGRRTAAPTGLRRAARSPRVTFRPPRSLSPRRTRTTSSSAARAGSSARTTTALTTTSTTVWSQVLPTPAQAYNSWLTFDPATRTSRTRPTRPSGFRTSGRARTPGRRGRASTARGRPASRTSRSTASSSTPATRRGSTSGPISASSRPRTAGHTGRSRTPASRTS